MINTLKRQLLPARMPHVAIAAAILMIGACATSSEPVLTKLDPRTSVTATYIKSPLIFFRSLSGTQAEAREYVYIGPLEVNRSGDYRYYLWLANWSMMDTGQLVRPGNDFKSIAIVADGKAITLEISGDSLQSVGASESIYPRPVGWATEMYYTVTLEQLRLVAAATTLQVKFVSSGETFLPWDDQTASKSGIGEFLLRTAF